MNIIRSVIQRERVNMKNLVFYLVDVFAEKKYSGNQLAVVESFGNLSDLQMQAIANEMHFSETSFLLSERRENGGYDVRIFTPSKEVPFAGHPTLGTAYIIKQRMGNENLKTVVLNLKVDQITVDFENNDDIEEIAWMKQLSPSFGKKYEPSEFAELLNLTKKDFHSFPIQEVSTGLPFIIVPLKTLDAVKRARVDVQLENNKNIQAGILVFCPETYSKENDLNVRVFANAYGISEDPATGSANGCLAGYLSYYKYFGGSEVDIRVEQGLEIGRPSLIHLKADNKQGKIQVFVGGKVVMVAKGELL
jgi:trans-2,3-dihydro-3-hydroxyanthranilate isomerase